MRALITGASSGIGHETAHLLASNGYELILAARRLDKLESLKTQIQKTHPNRRIWCYPLDLTDLSQIQNFSQKMCYELSQVTVLINNAGLALGAEKLQNSNPEDWKTMLSTNVSGLLFMTHSILPYFLKNQNGFIVNIGSVAGRWTYPGGAVYCASKAAVKALSEGLRLDLMGTPIRVTNIEPGMVETEFSEIRLKDSQKAKAVYQNMTPLTGRDVANTILWCLSQPPHVNIQEIVIFPTDQAGVGYVHRKTHHL